MRANTARNYNEISIGTVDSKGYSASVSIYIYCI